jgi:hypothetical protein
MAALEEEILTLSPYAVEVRYDDMILPDLDEASAAIEIASRTHALAQQTIDQDASHEAR